MRNKIFFILLLFSVSLFTYADDDYSKYQLYSKSIPLSGNSLSLSIDSLEVEVRDLDTPGNVRLEFLTNNPFLQDYDIKTNQSGGLLNLNIDKKNKRAFSKGKLVMYIPSNISSLKIETASADIDINLYSLTKISYNIDTKSGDIDFKQGSGKIDAKSNSGDIDINNFKFLENSNIETSFGDIDLEYVDLSNIKISALTVAGYISTVDNKNNGRNLDIGSGAVGLSLKSNSGDIDINDR